MIEPRHLLFALCKRLLTNTSIGVVSLLFILITGFAQNVLAADDYSQWIYSQNCTLNTTAAGANIGSNVFNFPVLIRLNPVNFDLNFGLSTGADLRFSKSDGTHLNYSIERFDGGTPDSAEIWVRLDTVRANQATQFIKMYWGNGSAADSSRPQVVFDTALGFAAVYHFPKSTDSLKDATWNAHHATVLTGAPVVGTGGIGRSMYFNGSSKAYMGFFDSTYGKFNISAWINKPATNTGTPFCKSKGSNASWIQWQLNPNAINMSIAGAGGYPGAATTTTPPNDSWYYLSANYERNLDTSRIYYNGIRESRMYHSTGDQPDQRDWVELGRGNDGSYLTGYLDEVRIESVIRSADWIKLCYQNQQATQTLVKLQTYTTAKKRTWVGTTAVWELASNWNPAGIPQCYDTVLFSNGANCNLAAATQIGSLQISSYTATFNTGNNKLQVNGPLTSATSGTLTLGSDSLIILGNADFSGLTTLNRNTSTVVIKSCGNGVNRIFTHGSKTFNNLVLWCDPTGTSDATITPASGTLTVSGNLIFQGTKAANDVDGYFAFNTNNPGVSVSGAISKNMVGTATYNNWVQLNMGNGTWTCGGNVVFSPADNSSSGSSVMNLTGTGTQSVNMPSGLNTVNHTGTGTMQLTAVPLTCSNNFSQTAGILNLNGFNLTTTGNFSITNGTSTSVNQTTLAGRTITVGGTTTLTGNSGADLLYLTPASLWTLTSTGSITATNCKIGYSTATNSNGRAAGSSNDGNNIGWIFGDDYSTWSYSKKIFINTSGSGANVSNNVTKFPVLIRLNPEVFGGFANTNATGSDIRFAKSDGTHLSYQIEQWVDNASNNDTAAIWVKLDTVYGNNASQYIRMYYGKSTAVDSSNGTAVFDTTNGFVGVWHLGETGSSSANNYKDATINAFHGTGSAAPAFPDQIGGVIGNGAKFISSENDNIAVGSSSKYYSSTFTMSCWVNYAYNGLTDYGRLFGSALNCSNMMGISQTAAIKLYGSGGWFTTTATLSSSYKYVTATMTGTTMRLFVDGVEAGGSPFTKTYNSSSGAMNIGNKAGSDPYLGSIDEARYEKTARDSNWVRLCYENQKAASTVVTMDPNYSAWPYSKKLYLNTTSSGVNVPYDVRNFPVLVRINRSVLTAFEIDAFKSDGTDVRFTKSDGTNLAYQIERFENAIDSAEVWVKIDTVRGNNNTQYITMYWGNSTASDLSNGPAVFGSSNGFKVALHCNDNAASSTVADAAGYCNGKMLTNRTTPDNTSNHHGTGVAAGGISFNRSNFDRLWLDTLYNTSYPTALSVSWWMKPGIVSNYANWITSANVSGVGSWYGFTFNLDANHKVAVGIGGLTGVYESGPSLSDTADQGVWNYFTYTNYGSSNGDTAFFYKNGRKINSVNYRQPTRSNWGGMSFSAPWNNVNDQWDGGLDEVWLSNTCRDSNWVRLCYENQKAFQTLVSPDAPFEDYSAWAYSKKIYINTTVTGANVSNNVYNFPLLVRLNTSNFSDASFNQVAGTGRDLRFAKSNGEHLRYQVERFSATVDSAEVWVKVDTVLGNNNSQYITMYWGNGVAVDSSNGAAVFDTGNGFVGVWQFNNNDFTDKTYNANNGVNQSTANTGGVIGNGRSFNGTSQHVMVGSSSSLNPTSAITMSAWVNAANWTTADRRIFQKGNSDNQYQLNVQTSKIMFNNIGVTGGQINSNTLPSLSVWHLIHATYSSAAGSTNIFFDGALDKTQAASGSISTSNDSLAIGFKPGSGSPTDHFSGLMDNVVISKVARDSNWIKLCYQNQKPGSTILDFEDYSTWTYSRNLSVNTTVSGANVSGNVVDFPMLVRLSGNDFDFSQANSGNSLRFAKPNGSHLAYEIEQWNAAGSPCSASVWVRMDTVVGNSVTPLVMYWGNSGVSSKSSGSVVFDTANAFRMVMHLNETGATTANNYKDATYNGIHGTQSTANRVPTQITGDIGYGALFDGTSGNEDYVTTGTSTSLSGNFTSPAIFTLSAWVRNDGQPGTYSRIFDYENAGVSGRFNFTCSNTGAIQWYSSSFGGGTGSWYGSGYSLGASLTHLALTYSGSAVRLYANGALVSGSPFTYTIAAEAGLNGWIGASLAGTEGFKGIIDEVVLSKTVRDANWIKLSYETQKPTASALTFDQFLPITFKQTASACSVYTTKWTLVFDKSTGKGGGITMLTDSANAKGGASPNQVDAGKNLFMVVFGSDTSKNSSGTWELMDSASTHVRIRQTSTITSTESAILKTEYTILGSGRMGIRSELSTAAGFTGKTLKFLVDRTVLGTMLTRASNTTANLADYVLLSSDDSRGFDILLSPFNVWNTTSGYESGATGFDNSSANGNVGYVNTSFKLNPGQTQTWDFMLDFSHKGWNDTAGTGVSHRVADYRSGDTLNFLAGTPNFEKDWVNNLFGHWKFDDNTGTVAGDNSGSNHDATLSTGVFWVNGKWGYADSLATTGAATDDSLTVPHSALFNNNKFTVMMWLKPKTTLVSSMGLFDKMAAGNAGLKILGATNGSTTGVIEADVNAVTVKGHVSLGTAVWHHVAVAYNIGTISLYVDGRLDTFYAGTMPLTSNTRNVAIGKAYDGVIDDVRYYGDYLLADDIKTVYQKGFRSSRAYYDLRADNNNTTHFYMNGNTTPHYMPMVQLSNYWATVLPRYVLIDNQQLVSGRDYIASLDDNANVLTLGFSSVIARAGQRIYIDDDDLLSNNRVVPMPKMYWGMPTATTPHVQIKNFAGNTFGSTNANHFFFDWKMGLTSSNQGEISKFYSSVVNPGATLDTAANTNVLRDAMVAGYDPFGFAAFQSTSTGWLFSYSSVQGSLGYTLPETSSTRIVLRLNERVLNVTTTDSIRLTTQWTIYPTGQMFRWDSISRMKNNVQKVYTGFNYKSLTSPLGYANEAKMRGGLFDNTVPDFSAAFLSFKNSGGVVAKPFKTDTVGFINDANYKGIEFYQASGDVSAWNSVPIQWNEFVDIHGDNLAQSSVDSVCNGVQYISALTMSTGTAIIDSANGDLNKDGFNEREGAYVMQSLANSVHFVLPAGGDTCRFFPAFRIKNYYSDKVPQYVLVDGLPQQIGFGYNAYVKKSTRELIVQFNSVYCKSTDIYISSDKTLAVTMSGFWANPGDNRDTICWNTESESDNLGYVLYRRVNLAFIDSINAVIDTMHGVPDDSTLDNAAKMVLNKSLGIVDTGWVRVNQQMIPAAKAGASYGRRTYRFVDYRVKNDVLYEYVLEAIDTRLSKTNYGPITVKPRAFMPMVFALMPNYPNPFRQITYLRFALPVKTPVTLNIYNIQGRLIRSLIVGDKKFNPGIYRVSWDCTDNYGKAVASGPYIYRLTAAKFAKARMMVLVK